MNKTYDNYMKKCFRLAKKGEGKTSPNPMVGCIVLDKFGKELSTGYHSAYGKPHAERDALSKITKEQAQGGTLIVNLEPCSHHGKTPPCVDIIIEKGIKTVVYAVDDPNPIASKGADILKKAGIKVIKGILEEEAINLNEVFFKNVSQNLPFIALKTATTIDGKIATKTNDSKWITSEKSRNYGKKLRKKYDAILTSSSTILSDNPQMIASTKIIIDRELKTINKNFDIYNQGKIFVITDENNNLPKVNKNIEFIKLPTKNNLLDLNNLFPKLFNLGIKSIFVESGSKLSGYFIKNDFVDKIYQFIAPKVLNDNSGKSCFNGDDILKINLSKNYKINSAKVLSPDLFITYSKV